MVLSIPDEKMREIAEYFFYHQGMGERSIAELLCIPKSMVIRLLDDSLEAIMEGMNGKREEIEEIFENFCADPPRNEKRMTIYKQRI